MSNTILVHCPLCDANSYSTLKTFPDNVVVGKCNQCNLVYTPKMHQSPESLFFERQDDLLKFWFSPIARGIKKHYRYKNFVEYHDIIIKYSKGKKCLDVGCAHGTFLSVLRDKGFAATGIEPSAGMHKIAREVFNLNVHHGTFNTVDLGNEKWDVVTFTDSLEYFPNPLGDLKKLKQHLNPNAIVFIKVPNESCFSFRTFIGKITGIKSIEATAYTPSLRVCHYDLKTLKKLLEKSGYKVLETGSCKPIHAPIWQKVSGYELITEMPWWMDFRRKTTRNIGWVAGKIQELLGMGNSFAPSIYIIATPN